MLRFLNPCCFHGLHTWTFQECICLYIYVIFIISKNSQLVLLLEDAVVLNVCAHHPCIDSDKISFPRAFDKCMWLTIPRYINFKHKFRQWLLFMHKIYGFIINIFAVIGLYEGHVNGSNKTDWGSGWGRWGVCPWPILFCYKPICSTRSGAPNVSSVYSCSNGYIN